MTRRPPEGRLARGGKLGTLAAKQAVRGAGTRLSMIGRSEQAKTLLAERATIEAAESLVTVLGAMKGAAMKIGQMLSVIELDLVPESHREQFRAKLAALRDQAPQVSFDQMRKVLETDLGPLSTVFVDFDESPVAAASIGQVYRARLRDGRDVAVKVQYPGIDQAVRADVRNLAFVMKLVQTVFPSANSAMLDEIARNFESELDYLSEAKTQHHVAARYEGHPFIVVPDSVIEYCTRRVLVTEFLDGAGFEHMRTLPDAERNRIGELIYRFYIGSLFTLNEFCGDPHPGNILLARDGRVGFIDFGLYNRMDPANVAFEKECILAAAEWREQDLYQLMVGRGVVDAASEVTPEDCLEYVRAASEWHLIDEEISLTPELATGAVLSALDPRQTQFAGMRRQMAPPEHAFSRRADFLTFGTLGHLRSSNNWHRIGREWFYGEPPCTDIGREIARWQAGRQRMS
ncbi:AarF/ABC1/UbiB kinase family protein [Mycobacterium sp. CBMA293]|uniref:ABC1 kinase family protein n=2 Tax=Mycolicibacterium TaxID=1866885 RepID=UPI0012DFB157|nr:MULTISPECIES: AarF/ABC1/UbiB kinase family protein [unclassified Mycolicibacterium]MUL47402.1 AarF/ABC1/UbiB kinase family protein [Mycolicibacterium sp. CBMA 360]MUL59387.1 AarF/ABC1/UbiB kinase family protein [Mycolicibacterium sp. CBMA 335]MUL71112.1 AarF/ABC1/UbiB kinase family protein [Mycolicibacterium sp. CBMA 311]MUL94755.1 AarF/ABC1/UbiB kinase family protein [Mycolicibacterium sp. CBMA 230]MUM03596.1 ATP-binding protein [Mycolicibacterium sp. CBMA 213]